MKRLHAIAVSLVLLVFAAGFAMPAEDLPETAYDESETLPYERAPQLSNVIAHVTGAASEVVRYVPQVKAPAESLAAARSILAEALGLGLAPSLQSRVFPIRC